MSAHSTLLIDRSGEVTEEQILEVLLEETEYGYDADIDLNGQGSAARWVVVFSTKYTVGGLENAAERLSKELHCRVDVVEEWDNRDADGPGREAYSYDRGVRVLEERVVTVPPGEVIVLPRATVEAWRALLTQDFPLIDAVTRAIDEELAG